MFVGLPFENASAQIENLRINNIKKCFDKIIENVGVNRAPVRICPSSRAGDSSRDTFEKENVIRCK